MKRLIAFAIAAEVIAIVAFIAGYDAGWRTKREPDSLVPFREREWPANV